MRSQLLLALCAALAGCVQMDLPNVPVRLQPPYSNLPDPPPGAAIEPGVPFKLDGRQQEVVVSAVLKWMKDPSTASFGNMAAAKNHRGWITVCGTVNGRNSAGVYSGMVPFIGVLDNPAAADFVVVEIGSYGPQRADVGQLCADSGVYGVL